MHSNFRMGSKVFLFVSVVTLLLSVDWQPSYAQRTMDGPRLGIELKCPSYVLAPNQTMKLQAEVFGSKELLKLERADLISYRWEISGGKVVVGQGTPTVTVEAIGLPSSGLGLIDARIKLNGGPPDLNREKSCKLRIDPTCAQPVLFDQYEDISWKDEQQRLDRLAKHLQGEASESVVFVVAYAGMNSCLSEAEKRLARMKKYLSDAYKIEACRIITADGGFRDKLNVDYFIASRGSCGPFPTPTLVGSAVNIQGSCDEKY